MFRADRLCWGLEAPWGKNQLIFIPFVPIMSDPFFQGEILLYLAALIYQTKARALNIPKRYEGRKYARRQYC